jgi:hypothetical protein
MEHQQPQQQPVKTVTLAPTRAALAWDRATDQLVAAAEDAEAQAKARFEVAKLAYQEARQQAHLMRQKLRQIARVDGAPERPESASREKSPHPGRHALNGPCKGCQNLGISNGN